MEIAVFIAGAVVVVAGMTGLVLFLLRRRGDRVQLSSSKEIAVREPGRHAATPPPIDDELALIPVAVTAESAKHAA